MLNATNVEAIQNGVKAIRTLSDDEKIREYVRQRDKAIQDYNSDMSVARSQGVLDALTGLVKKGMLTISQAAEEAQMTEDEFRAKTVNI